MLAGASVPPCRRAASRAASLSGFSALLSCSSSRQLHLNPSTSIPVPRLHTVVVAPSRVRSLPAVSVSSFPSPRSLETTESGLAAIRSPVPFLLFYSYLRCCRKGQDQRCAGEVGEKGDEPVHVSSRAESLCATYFSLLRLLSCRSGGRVVRREFSLNQESTSLTGRKKKKERSENRWTYDEAAPRRSRTLQACLRRNLTLC